MSQLHYKKGLTALAACLALIGTTALTGCGGGSSPQSFTEPTTETSTASPVVPVAAPSLALSVSNTQLTAAAPITVTAVVKDSAGVVVPNAVVVFKNTSDAFGVFESASGTRLTDSKGVATIQLKAGTETGADTIVATAAVGEAVATGKVSYAVSASTVASSSTTLSPITLGTPTLGAYGTTSVSVTVNQDGKPFLTPLEVTFNSSCVGTGKASITKTVTTIAGVATASYVDDGCASTDMISASVAGVTTPSTKSLVVASPSLGSIQFVSASPSNITLKGTGGSGQSETSLVKFKVVDQAGKPIKADVNFALSTSIGGLSLSSSAATSDATTGLVQTNVKSGTIATPVRVTATVVDQPELRSQSDALSISIGLPDQAHFSLSASAHNIEGWNIDGATSTIQVYSADHFSNSVPDGTAINFIAEGAAVGNRCETKDGGCNVVFRSQNLRPDNGRVTLMAFAVGEEAFVDGDGSGQANLNGELVDANGKSSDLAEAYLDYNENGKRDFVLDKDGNPTTALEPYQDFNADGLYSVADSLFNGALCATGFAKCTTAKTVHVRQSNVMVLSGSQAYFYDASAAATINYTVFPNPFVKVALPNTIDLGGCPTAAELLADPTAKPDVSLKPLSVLVVDLHQNPMPIGTTISATIADNGKLVGNTSWVVGDTSDGRSQIYTVNMKSDASVDATCTDTTHSGVLTITATTKGVSSGGTSVAGTITSRSINIVD